MRSDDTEAGDEDPPVRHREKRVLAKIARYVFKETVFRTAMSRPLKAPPPLRSVESMARLAFRRFHALGGYGALNAANGRPRATDEMSRLRRWREHGSCSGNQAARGR